MGMIITLLVGAAIASLILFGYIKGMPNLFIVAIILAFGFIGHLYFWAGLPKVAKAPVFRGPIIIKIEPPKDESKAVPETKADLKEFFKSGNARNPFQAPSGF